VSEIKIPEDLKDGYAAMNQNDEHEHWVAQLIERIAQAEAERDSLKADYEHAMSHNNLCFKHSEDSQDSLDAHCLGCLLIQEREKFHAAKSEYKHAAKRIAEMEAVLEGLINQRNDFQDCPLWCKKDCEWCKAKTILAKKGN
jgi:hypothetical protein